MSDFETLEIRVSELEQQVNNLAWGLTATNDYIKELHTLIEKLNKEVDDRVDSIYDIIYQRNLD